MTKGRFYLLASLVATVSLLIGMIIAGSFEMTPPSFALKEREEEVPAYQEGTEEHPPLNFADIVDKVNPTVVNITSVMVVKGESLGRSPTPLEEFFFGPDFFRQRPGEDIARKVAGSGIVISKDGYILTNHHVVRNADQIKVKLSDDKEFKAKLIGSDQLRDIALIKIDAERDLSVAILGDSDKVRVGEWVMAIGNPVALDHTATVGVISAKGRTLGAENVAFFNYLQTDAAINEGNSGGPLINLKGEVIGINTLIVAMRENLGFAIPINMAKKILPDLMKGKVTYGYLGITPQELTPELAEMMKLPSTEGTLVGDVQEGTPAAEAGLQKGDVITEFDGKKVDSRNALYNIVAETSPGKKVKIKIIRQGKVQELTATITERPELQEAEAEREEGEEIEGKIGISVENLTSSLARRYGYTEDMKGVLVTQVQPLSPAADAGISRGDVIREINQVAVENVSQYRRLLRDALSKGDVVLFYISSVDAFGNVTSRYVAVRVG
ncbi:MAG: Do family serine endopeptidase [Candidatus Aminicenantes bacterium]|nr:Do family serine endopeptidase [Candidatus Aminicenantes bacterium]